MSDFFAGIDIGGTKTRIGVVSADAPGVVLASVTVPTAKDDPRDATLAIADEASRLLPVGGRFLAACACAPGPLNIGSRTLGFLPNLRPWSHFPLGDALEAAFQVPVILQNDANAAAYGELIFGAGKSLTDFIFVTLGTGIGGAVVAGGRLITGGLGGAGEIGHLQVDPNGPPCGCGRRGCVEAYASGPSIAREYGKSPQEAFASAISGEARAREVLDRAGRALGAGLAPLITMLEPQAVVLGGGIAQAGGEALSFYLGPCIDEAMKRAYRMWGQDVPFLIATLGDAAPLLGAAFEARQHYEGNHTIMQATCQLSKDPSSSREDEVLRVEKPWGEEIWWARTDRYVGKRILVKAGHSLSLQYHEKKLESMYFMSGEGVLTLGDRDIPITPGLSVTIPPGTRHRVLATSSDVVFFEASTPEVEDVVRLEDRYGRM